MAQRQPPPGFAGEGGGVSQQGLGLGGFGQLSAAPAQQAFRLAPGAVNGGPAAPPQPRQTSLPPGAQGSYMQAGPVPGYGLPGSGPGWGQVPPHPPAAHALPHPPPLGRPVPGGYPGPEQYAGARAPGPGDAYGAPGARYPGGGPGPIGPPPLQPGIVGTLPPELRHVPPADSGSALLRLLQRNSYEQPGQQPQQPPPMRHPGPPMPPGGAYNPSQLAGMMSDLRVGGGQPHMLQQRPPPPPGPHQPAPAYGMGGGHAPPFGGMGQTQSLFPPGGSSALGLFGQRQGAPLQQQQQQQPVGHPGRMPMSAQPIGAPQRPAAPPVAPPPMPEGSPPPRGLVTPARVNQREVREAALAARQETGNKSRFRPPTPAPLKANSQALCTQLGALVQTLQPSERDTARQMECFSRLRALLLREWQDGELHMYGSCANGFGGPSSDIDTCLALRWADTPERKRSVVQRIAELASEAGGYSDILALTHARMPVAKLHDTVTGVSADVCVNNFLAVCNTRMLRDYAGLDVRMRQLGYLVKHWAKKRGVNEPYTGTLSSYCYILMCIHLLQTRTPPVLPCLQAAEHTFSRDIDGLRVGYNDDARRWRDYGARNQESLAQLLHAFFDYWAWRHDYGGAVVCVRSGSIVTKRRKGWTTRVGTERHLICVEDPFETSHDLGRVVDKRSIFVLRDEFERAERILRTDPDPLPALFEEYVAPASKDGPGRGQGGDADDADEDELEERE